jgi:putative FmdB family regulatory protein
MPIYEYRCMSCERVTEVIQRMGARAPGKCEHCDGKLEKLVSRTSFLLKGGGWFAEGYGNDGRKSAGEKKEKAPATTDSAKKSKPKKKTEKKS